MRVIVDTREPKQNHKFLVKAFPDHVFEWGTLPEGDYSTDKVIVERKTVSDLYSSIVGNGGKPGRFGSQVSRLSCHNQIILILVIGDVQSFISRMSELGVKINVDIIYGALASVSCRENIHVMWMENEWNAMITMIRFMIKVENDEYMVPARRDPDILLARYFKITPKQLVELKNKFTSIYAMADASEKELMSVKGIGKVKAKNIKDLICNGW